MVAASMRGLVGLNFSITVAAALPAWVGEDLVTRFSAMRILRVLFPDLVMVPVRLARRGSVLGLVAMAVLEPFGEGLNFLYPVLKRGGG